MQVGSILARKDGGRKHAVCATTIIDGHKNASTNISGLTQEKYPELFFLFIAKCFVIAILRYIPISYASSP